MSAYERKTVTWGDGEPGATMTIDLPRFEEIQHWHLVAVREVAT